MTATFIAWATPSYWGREKEYVLDAVSSTWISGGEYVERFERAFSEYHGADVEALAASSGTAAINLAYLAMNIQGGDEIIMPGFGFLAAANIALQMSAIPVFCGVDSNTWCVTAGCIEPYISKRTKAIVVIHTYGGMCDMPAIMILAKKHDLYVIEDAAESFGSRIGGQLAGTFADIGVFSFHATKTITTGEGGMVLTRNKALLSRMALHQSHGMMRKKYYWHELPGHNFRLTNMQAAMGCAQLECLEQIFAERSRVYQAYRARLDERPDVCLQQFYDGCHPVVWAVAVKLNIQYFPQGRDVVLEQLFNEHIEARPGFYTPSQMTFYNSQANQLCDDLSANIICLPASPYLYNHDIDRVCSALFMLSQLQEPVVS